MPFVSDAFAQLRVLYLDDDVGLGILVRKALARRGHSVTHVTDSQQAFDLLVQGGFDAIALDHSMPGETGLDVLASLAARGERLPVVYVTASADARLALQAIRAGANEYVVKDSSAEFYDLLIAAIENVTERWRLKQQRAADQKAVLQARDRAELLLQEVNHRVANSLGLVVAMVRMQSTTLSDPAAIAALQETQARITAIAGVHRRLYISDHIGLVDIEDYLGHLVGELQTSLADEDHPYEIRLSAERLTIPTDKAISLGVIVGELVTNAFKYAYAIRAPGEIRVSVRRDEGAAITLIVEDDGQGFDPQSPNRGTGLGSKILKAMASSLKAAVAYPPYPAGTRVQVTFPID